MCKLHEMEDDKFPSWAAGVIYVVLFAGALALLCAVFFPS